MNLVTLEFIDRVLYHRAQALILTGAPYINAVTRELLDCRVYAMGEAVVEHLEMQVKLYEMDRNIRSIDERLFTLIELGGSEEEALAIFVNTLGIEEEE